MDVIDSYPKVPLASYRPICAPVPDRAPGGVFFDIPVASRPSVKLSYSPFQNPKLCRFSEDMIVIRKYAPGEDLRSVFRKSRQ